MRNVTAFRRTGLDSKPVRHLKKLKATTEGLLRRSPRLQSLRENNKKKTPPRKKVFNWDNATTEEITKRVLCDYNKKHGTNLEFVRLGKDKRFFGLSYFIDFERAPGFWMHLNFEARQGDADPRDKPLVLFAELMQNVTKYHLITLSIVKHSDESNGCIRCVNCVTHPRHGFRAGLFREPTFNSGPEKWSQQAAAQLSEIALQSYNKKHGTTIKFEKALNCYSFVCFGLTMDFNENKTKWVHMNFEVRVGVGCFYKSHERVVRLFAELYLGNDGEYVLATLSPAAPEVLVAGAEEWRKFYRGEEWRKEYTGVKGCVFCPADILHPKANRFAYPEGFGSSKTQQVLPKQT